MRVSLRHFRFFVATAESGQVSKAAATLFTSQSAVTEAIKALESDTGVKLFERHPKGVALTYEGSVFLQHARSVLAAAADAMLAPQQVRRDMSGEFTLACTHTVAGYFLPPILARFRRLFPGVVVQLVELKRPEIERCIDSGEIELAMCLTSALKHSDQIETDVLARSRRRLWLPANHHLLQKARVSLADVHPEPYIMLTLDDAEETTHAYWREAGLQPKVVFRTSSMEAIRNMVVAGLGVTILSDMVYRPWSLEGARLDVMSISDALPNMDVGLAWRRDSALSRYAKVFVDVCRMAHRDAPSIGYDDA